MRPCSIVVSGNKKRRSAHTETRRPGPDILGINLFIPRRPLGERGDNFIGSPYTSYSPFIASCLLIAIMQSQELDFLKMTVLSDRKVPLAAWVAQPAKKRRVGPDHRARRRWSSSLNTAFNLQAPSVRCHRIFRNRTNRNHSDLSWPWWQDFSEPFRLILTLAAGYFGTTRIFRNQL